MNLLRDVGRRDLAWQVKNCEISYIYRHVHTDIYMRVCISTYMCVPVFLISILIREKNKLSPQIQQLKSTRKP